MGTDMDLYAEIRGDDGAWRPVPEPVKNPRTRRLEPVMPLDYGRPRNLISVLSGSHAGIEARMAAAPIPKIAEPRGFPEDMNPVFKDAFAEYLEEDCGFWGFTWLLLREIIDFDWHGHRFTKRGFVAPEHAGLFSAERPFPESFPEEAKTYSNVLLRPPDGLVEVHWSMSLADFIGCLDWLVDGLRPLGPPDDVRIILFFNC